VRASAESASSTGGDSSKDRFQVSVNRSRAPSSASNVHVTDPSATSSGTGVVSRNESGPDVTSAPSAVGSTHGTIEP
jgi:hypothetical protein